MTSHTLETTITIGSSEVPATVVFDFCKGYVSRVPRGEYLPLEPDEPASVTVEKITLHHPKDRARNVVLTDGLLFDACNCEWLQEQCFDLVSEDA